MRRKGGQRADGRSGADAPDPSLCLAQLLVYMRLHLLSALLLAMEPSATALRRVLVTGGNKGIGQAICKRILCDYPDAHVLLGSRNQARGDKAVQQIVEAVPGAAGRIETLALEVTTATSVAAAAAAVAEKYATEETPLHGLVCNAGVGFGQTISETLAVNLYGAKRCCEAFVPLLAPDGGRVVTISSASAPNFVAGLDAAQQQVFTSPQASWAQLDEALQRYAASSDYEGQAYGLSKAALTQYTMQLAAAQPRLKVNACSPGYVLTDLTAGMGATKRPDESNCHVAPLFLLFGEVPTPAGCAHYYGSDAVRSPLNVYRGPGDPPYTE